MFVKSDFDRDLRIAIATAVKETAEKHYVSYAIDTITGRYMIINKDTDSNYSHLDSRYVVKVKTLVAVTDEKV